MPIRLFERWPVPWGTTVRKAWSLEGQSDGLNCQCDRLRQTGQRLGYFWLNQPYREPHPCEDAAVVRFTAAATLVRLGKVSWTGGGGHVALGCEPFRGPMNAQEAMIRLSGTLIKVRPDRYRLACGKAALFVRLLGTRTPVRFAARDRLLFRIDAENLTVEDRRTRAILIAFPWYRIESVAAGEPESERSFSGVAGQTLHRCRQVKYAAQPVWSYILRLFRSACIVKMG